VRTSLWWGCRRAHGQPSSCSKTRTNAAEPIAKRGVVVVARVADSPICFPHDAPKLTRGAPPTRGSFLLFSLRSGAYPTAARFELELGLVLHELATAKHGALSVPGGTVVRRARAGGTRVTLCWRERGGPNSWPPRAGGIWHETNRATLGSGDGRATV
jgi:hypothetical protein